MLKTWSRFSRSRLTVSRKDSRKYISHGPPSIHKIKLAFTRAKIPFQIGFTCLRVRCPKCSRDSDKIQGYLNPACGTFVCDVCELVAEWDDFKRALDKKGDIEHSSETHAAAFPTQKELEEIQKRLSSAVEIETLPPREVQRVLERLELNRIKASTLLRSKYHICYEDTDHPKLVLPVKSFRNRLVGLKYVGKDNVETFPRTGMAGHFVSEHLVSESHAVVVPHPADAILVTQETKLTSIAVDSTAQLPVTRLPLFEKYKKLTIWFEGTNEQWHNAVMYARKLGRDRTFYIRQIPEFHRPLLTKNIPQALRSERPMLHKSVTVFEELREALRDALTHWETVAGIKYTRFPGLNKYLKGHRRGELTIFTGQTGSGKTTFLCELSMDLMLQGIPTLWGSFEINNVRLLKTLMTQFALRPLTENMENFDEIADQFQKLPLFMLKFHGEENLHNIMEAMTHAVYVNDIQHVILDNLQFMMGVTDDRFQRQDMIISAMRRFATEYNVHVTLVVHPRKEKDDDPLGTSSIFGSGKASQEADNVLILQRSAKGTKFIQVKKNRFDGDLGAFVLTYDKATSSYWAKPPQPAKIDDGKSGRRR